MNRFYQYKNERKAKLFCLSTYASKLLASLYNKTNINNIIIDRTCNFCHEQHGKPTLLNNNLNLSISYSADKVAIGFSKSSDIGIDIEKINKHNSYIDIYNLTLTDYEIDYINSIPKNHQNIEFIKFWTLKESILKCFGDGLTIDLKAIEFDISGTEIILKKKPQKYQKAYFKNFKLDQSISLSITTKNYMQNYNVISISKDEYGDKIITKHL
ncbi:4'-phosphopantetheinyl transferase family protein [Mammaliicoccus sciuri]|uniref:4'-phosphopantetheinyl transferase family protein n=1 Tax=Mammaliicoccus sciuri TaxID=1296 RepID=UPI00143034E4|nr:4'-phosphopantetheinyl transferase superfamily protein [Mammaliicoccus sciuri]MBF0773764.1 4'-phosphopantetheinyl transferase superfamily protein [Mammaliicoccus sciuri]